MHPASFEYASPRSLTEVLDLLARYGDDAKLLAGGQSLIPSMKLRLAQPPRLVDLSRLPDLRGIRADGDTLVIGALTLHADIASSTVVRDRLPGLAEAAGVIGDVQVRNRGTIGGSIAHADPGADLPVILTALNASFMLVSASGTRIFTADSFFLDFFTTALRPDEVLTEVRVPLTPPGSGTAYAKLPHPASGYVVVSAGALIQRDTAGRCTLARVAIGGLEATPHRASACEATLIGAELTADVIQRAAATVAEGTSPADDLYASAAYKSHVATVYACRAIEAAAERASA